MTGRPSIYRQGKVYLTNGSSAVLGLGTNFTAYVYDGAQFEVAGVIGSWYVAQVSGRTTLTLDAPWTGLTGWHAYTVDNTHQNATADAARLDAAKTAKRAELANNTRMAITQGVMSMALGAEHLYPTGMTDQANLNRLFGISLARGAAGEPYPIWCRDTASGTWARRNHTTSQLESVAESVDNHVRIQQIHYEDLLANVDTATTIEQVNAIAF